MARYAIDHLLRLTFHSCRPMKRRHVSGRRREPKLRIGPFRHVTGRVRGRGRGKGQGLASPSLTTCSLPTVLFSLPTTNFLLPTHLLPVSLSIKAPPGPPVSSPHTFFASSIELPRRLPLLRFALSLSRKLLKMEAQRLASLFSLLLVLLVAASATVSAQVASAPSPSMQSDSSVTVPAVGAVALATLMSFMALFSR